MESPILSIIVPIYNVEPYLKQCLDSIKKQTFTNFEAILIDDGSPDGCGRICDEYALADSRFKVIHQKNKGLLATRKVGVSKAIGTYVGFVDSDDWIADFSYEKMIEQALQHDTDIVLVSGLRVAEKGKPKSFSNTLEAGLYDKQRLIQEVYPIMLGNHDMYANRNIQPSVCLKIFRKTLIESVYSTLTHDIVQGEDMACSYSCLLNAQSIYVLDHSIKGYFYRYNPNSVSWTYKKNLLQQSMNLCDFLRSNPLGKDIPQYQMDIYYEECFFAIQSYFNEYLTKNRVHGKEKIKRLRAIVEHPQVVRAMNTIDMSTIKFPNHHILKIMQAQSIWRMRVWGNMMSLLQTPIMYVARIIM